jgi:hypothetical protein
VTAVAPQFLDADDCLVLCSIHSARRLGASSTGFATLLFGVRRSSPPRRLRPAGARARATQLHGDVALVAIFQAWTAGRC